MGRPPGTTVAAALKGRLTQSCPKAARLITPDHKPIPFHFGRILVSLYYDAISLNRYTALENEMRAVKFSQHS
jgi:hypothetical protein